MILERDFSQGMEQFKHPWSHLDILSKTCATNYFGGLRSAASSFLPQIQNQGVFVCGAWWVWGNGKTISFRILHRPLMELQQEKRDPDSPPLIGYISTCCGLMNRTCENAESVDSLTHASYQWSKIFTDIM